MKLLYDITEIAEDSIYIYGAGMVAELLTIEIQQTTNIFIHAYTVTQHPGKNSYINGIPVVSLSCIPDTATVVIATLSDSHKDMVAQLEKKQIHLCYVVSETMFQNMRKKYVSERVKHASKKMRLNEMRRMAQKGWEGLFISDEALPEFSYKKENIEIISSRQFMEGIYRTKNPEIIYTLLIDWSGNWKEFIHKLFKTQAEIVLSYRFKYIKLEDFNLLDEARTQGFQLSGQKRFDRDRREFYTEDILFKFQKRAPETLTRDMLCTGCGKCMLECPAEAIHMQPNEHGYEKPICDKEKCISCNRCIEECPSYKIKTPNWNDINCYSFMAEDDIRLHSSSGGVFGVVAELFLENGGYVCGAAWNSDFTVSHRIISDKRDLPALQMSKYMKSDIVKVLPTLRELVKDKEKVLFVGCPCQVAAVKSFVGEGTEELFTMDLICAEAPSPYVFSKYLSENYEVENLKEIGFRDKATGWRPDVFHVVEQNGNKKYMHMEDLSQKAFHSRLMMAVCCEHCNFITYPREGDLTIGDAWGVTEHAPHLNDGKGTSTVLINTEKGKSLYRKIEQRGKRSEPIPFEWTTKNRTVDCVRPHIGRDRFYGELKPFGFNKAAQDALNHQYDIGLVGNWSYPNYGSELTYYALYQTLKELGYSVLMIEWAEDSMWKPYGEAQLFEWAPYENHEIAHPIRNHSEFYRYNQICRMFVQGSDQLLQPGLYEVFGKNTVLDWVDVDHKKLGYALSFGHEKIEYSETDQRIIAFHLDKFDGISVREDTAVTIMKEKFHIRAQQVLDPVFLCKRSVYEKLAERYIKGNESHLFAYIVDPTEDKMRMLKYTTQKKELELHIVSDAARDIEPGFTYDIEFLDKIPVEKWLAEMITSDFVITDSFHGACFSIILQKDFIVIANEERGATRFPSLLRQFGLESRLIWDVWEERISELLTQNINYDIIQEILLQKKVESMDWLCRHLEREHTLRYSEEYMILNEKYKELEKILYGKMWGR